MFLTKRYKILPLSKWQNWSKSNKNSTSHMLKANNISKTSYVPDIGLYIVMPSVWLQNYFSAIQAPNTYENSHLL